MQYPTFERSTLVKLFYESKLNRKGQHDVLEVRRKIRRTFHKAPTASTTIKRLVHKFEI